MAVESVIVTLGERSYPIRIGAGVFAEALAVAQEKKSQGKKCVAVTSPAIAHARPDLIKSLEAYMPVVITMHDGEKAKTATECIRLWDFLAEQGVARDGCIFAVGGGVVGDLAGFVAASYLRGISCIQIPTTLLAMVDSSVGGKTGINLTAGKNLVGHFHQPQAVYADTSLLSTLPAREFAAGMAEVVKHGLIADQALFVELQKSGSLNWQSPRLPSFIKRCVEIKAGIVAEDEFETRTEGGRALLNLGHTFGHAIEAVAGYGTYLHGEAVAIGLVMAAQLSLALHRCSASEASAIEKTLADFHLPTRLCFPLPCRDLLAAMQKDKKVRAGKLRFVLLQGVGKAETVSDIPESLAVQALLYGGATA
jgi:3-dehydroquinate synthase